MSYKSDLIDLKVELKKETPKAWLVHDGDREVWIPKSECELEKDRNNMYDLTIPEWLAMEKGLI